MGDALQWLLENHEPWDDREVVRGDDDCEVCAELHDEIVAAVTGLRIDVIDVLETVPYDGPGEWHKIRADAWSLHVRLCGPCDQFLYELSWFLWACRQFHACHLCRAWEGRTRTATESVICTFEPWAGYDLPGRIVGHPGGYSYGSGEYFEQWVGVAVDVCDEHRLALAGLAEVTKAARSAEAIA